MKRPYLLRGDIQFGQKNEIKEFLTPESLCRVVFDLYADVLNDVDAVKNSIPDSPNCPHQLLKFGPPPQNKYCEQRTYRDWTTLHDYGLNITFFNVSFNYYRIWKGINKINCFFLLKNRTQNGYKVC